MLYNIDNDNGSKVLQEKFKYTIGTIISRKSEKHIKCNGEKKRKTKTNNDIPRTMHKTKG